MIIKKAKKTKTEHGTKIIILNLLDLLNVDSIAATQGTPSGPTLPYACSLLIQEFILTSTVVLF